MDIVVRHTGEIDLTGKLKFDNVELFNDVKNRLRGKKIELTLKEKSEEKTVDQLGYYYGGVLKTAHATNQYDWLDKSEDLHEKVFAPKFLMYEKAVRTVNNKITMRKMIRSLSDLNQKEMSQFIERVIADLESDGIRVLLPSEYEIAKRYKTK